MSIPFTHGWHELADDTYAYLVPDGSWGLSNTGLIISDGHALLVDTQLTLPQTRRMLAELAELRPDVTVETVVTTHAHCDHIWGTQLLPGATVITSAAAAKELPDEIGPESMRSLVDRAKAGELGTLGTWLAAIFGSFDFTGITVRTADRTFTGELDVPVGNRTVHLKELGPAHTRGDIIAIAEDADTVFIGDLIFTCGHPVLWKGTVEDNISAAHALQKLSVSRFVPGHGPIGTHADIERFIGYLRQVEHDVTQAYRAGKTAAEAARGVDLRAFSDWSDPERVAISAGSIFRSLGDPNPVSQLDQLRAAAELAAERN